MGNNNLSFREFLHALQSRKLRLLLAAVLGGVVAVAISAGMPVHYTSEALLEVEAHSPLTRELDPAILPTTPDQVRTEADILQSRALAESVVRELNLAGTADFEAAPRPPTWIDRISVWLKSARSYAQSLRGRGGPDDSLLNTDTVMLFQRRLTVSADEKSHIVAVGFQTGSPTLSAEVIATLLKKYLSDQVGANVGVIAQENQWLTEHLAALQHDVDVAAARAQAFREANNLMDIQAGSLSALQLNEKDQSLSSARQDLAKAQADFDTATTAARADTGFIGQEALGSPLIQRLREREAEVLQRKANLEQRAGETSPYLRPLNAELSSVRQQIARETDKIVAALGRNVATAEIRVKQLESTVSAAQVQAQLRGGAAATLAQYNQDVDTKRHVYIAFLTRMEQTQLTSTRFPTARVVSAAVPIARPDGLSLWIVTLLGIFVGTFLSIAAILLRHVLGGRVSSAKDMEFITGVAPIGSIPEVPRAAGLPIPMRNLDMTQSNVVETLHAVSFAIQAMNPDVPCTRVLVTSSTQQEGKTTLAASVAQLTAASGKRVLLVEADLRRPRLGRMLGFSPGIGIESVLLRGHRLAEAVQVEPKSGLHCLTASASVPNVIKALRSIQFNMLMEQARVAYDMVFIDSPPMMLVVDPLILAKHSDVILFAVAFGRTPATMVAEALQRFPTDVRSRVATVLTRVPQSVIALRGYYAGYQRKLPASG